MEQIFLSMLFWSALGLGTIIGITSMILCYGVVKYARCKAEKNDI